MSVGDCQMFFSLAEPLSAYRNFSSPSPPQVPSASPSVMSVPTTCSASLNAALLQLLLPEVAAHHRVAVLVDAIGEVLAGHADHPTFPVLQVALVDEAPLLHSHPCQYSCTTLGGLVLATRVQEILMAFSNAAAPLH